MPLTLATILERFKAIHGDTYDYSKVVFTGSKHKVEIICRKHGPFMQTPEKHTLRAQGCPSCGAKKYKPRFTHEAFVAKSRKVHGSRYDYSRSVYTGSKSPIDIVCPDHGVFTQVVEYHWAGNGCQKCAIERRSDSQRYTTDIFMERSREAHGDRYLYDRVDYRGSQVPVMITCRDHGDFPSQPDHHMDGVGCPKCGAIQRATSQRRDTAWFIAEARKTHNDLYTYEKSVYTGALDPVEIICRKHGSFHQGAYSHYRGGQGCPSCFGRYTKPHKGLESFLDSLGVSYVTNTRSVIGPKELDIYLPDHNLAIEVNGVYWHSLTHKSSPRERFDHRVKFDLCRGKDIALLQILDLELSRELSRKVWEGVISAKLGKNKKIFARNTEVREIDRSEAKVFLAQHHIQGSTQATHWCFGLFHEEFLQGVATFSEHQRSRIVLSRMAFKAGTTVVGGSGKIMKRALLTLPRKDIVTFSNNRYSSGEVYRKTGFVKEADVPPSYEWFFRNKLFNKRQCRHKHLPKLLGDLYDPTLTEHQNMFRAGARCLYDAGYQRWLLPNTL